MNALQVKAARLYTEFIAVNNTHPKHVYVTIRWKDDKAIIKGLKIALYYLDNEDEDDDTIFFYMQGVSEFMSIIPPFDFVVEDFPTPNDFYAEVEKYDTDEDRDYYFKGDEFDVLDIINYEL